MEKGNFKEFPGFALRVMLVLTATYFLLGLIMSNIFHYEEFFHQETIKDFMRPMDTPYVFLSPMPMPLTLFVGLFPALIISISMPLIYQKVSAS